MTPKDKLTQPPIDKTQWGPGPWQTEPDHLHVWDRGFIELIERNPGMGNLCGYLGVFPGHPWHGLSLAQLNELAEPHGGFSWSAENCSDVVGLSTKKAAGHWFVGFDCGHAWDLSPGMRKYYSHLSKLDVQAMERDQVYRSWNFVRAEVRILWHAAYKAWKAFGFSRAKPAGDMH